MVFLLSLLSSCPAHVYYKFFHIDFFNIDRRKEDRRKEDRRTGGQEKTLSLLIWFSYRDFGISPVPAVHLSRIVKIAYGGFKELGEQIEIIESRKRQGI